MTEFYTHCGIERYFDFDDKVCDEETGKALTVKEIVDVLNELNDENKELKKQNEQLKSTMKEVIEPLYNRPYKGKVIIDDTLMAAINAYYEQYGAK